MYAYDPNEFMPVFRDNRLDNKAEFVAYKAERLAQAIGNVAQRTVQVASAAGSIVLEHIAQ